MKKLKGEFTMKYYSEKLNKIFDSEKELKDAEVELEKQEVEKAKLQEVKKARAKEVEDAYLHLQEVKEKAFKEIAEAEKVWVELRDKFAEDYHGYHMTYSNVNGEQKVTFGDILNNFFNW